MKLATAIVSLLSAASVAADGTTHIRRSRRLNQDSSCLEITALGVLGGPVTDMGLAQSSTLITYGTVNDNCTSGVKLLFDIGRGAVTNLSKKWNFGTKDIDAIFITHIHSDHVNDLSIFLQNLWHFNGNPVDIVCAQDALVTASDGSSRTMSCQQLIEHIDDPFTASGEIAQRKAENPARNPEGPSGLANTILFPPAEEPELVWESGDVQVKAIRTNHVGGSAAYRVDTPAGSVVISGDASNDNGDPIARPYSTSDQVELLANGTDVLVHAVIHPTALQSAPGEPGLPAAIYNRQSTAEDVGAMAQRLGAAGLILTHQIPTVGSNRFQNPLNKNDYRKIIADAGGYTGKILVATDMDSVRIPKNQS
ncbi:Ribonuclease Z [Seminavis robusta]|uniref:Ribonuclease Z n=1 Tax=Seminavis robusta TaxID=568900 RepID=A0A9N8DCI5_9STRA|nr:Ribonuclease Z [Seminavis robusta]|eukprot:Sro33_g021610.1 Ribonuclease Z (366) ;mRNA; f:121327-122424